MMAFARWNRGATSLAMAAALLGLGAGCTSTGNGLALRQTEAVTPYTVYRPAFQEPVRKPVYLSGYAGSNYGRGPRASYAPSGYLLQFAPPYERQPLIGKP
jgi:hypothetical protein